MSERVAAIIGSGTLPYTRGILPASQRGNEPLGEGIRVGSQVIVANPEDLNSVDAFAVSGVTVGSSVAVEVISPDKNPLPRCRTVKFYNATPGTTVYLGHVNDAGILLQEGIPVTASATLPQAINFEMPILHNVSIWAISSGTASLRMMIY